MARLVTDTQMHTLILKSNSQPYRDFRTAGWESHRGMWVVRSQITHLSLRSLGESKALVVDIWWPGCSSGGREYIL